MKAELTKQQFVIIVSVATAAALLGIWFILFRPLNNKVKLLHLEYKSLEKDVLQARDAVNFLKLKGLKKDLVSEANVSLAIEELTREGKAKCINFIWLTPKRIERQQAHSKMLPIEMELEASYIMLSDFFGKLDDLNRSIVLIRKFDVALNKLNPKILTTKLSLDMYILEQDAE